MSPWAALLGGLLPRGAGAHAGASAAGHHPRAAAAAEPGRGLPPRGGGLLSAGRRPGSFVALPFGGKGDVPLLGDWDGDGTATVGLYRPAESTFYLRNQNRADAPVLAIPFGARGDRPVVGDWDGKGGTTIGVYRPSESTFYLRDRNDFGEPTAAVPFGAKGDLPVAGDWNGDGTATVGVYRPSDRTFYLRQREHDRRARPDRGLRRPRRPSGGGRLERRRPDHRGGVPPGASTFLLRDGHGGAEAERVLALGAAGDVPVVGP